MRCLAFRALACPTYPKSGNRTRRLMLKITDYAKVINLCAY